MTPELHKKAIDLFSRACELEPSARVRFLDEACGGDADLRREVEGLLLADQAPPAFLEGGGAARFLDEAAREAQGADGIGPPVPERIGGFRIVRPIGRGGMGTVYEAIQDEPRRSVALKVISPGIVSEWHLKRFEHEAYVLGQLQHPGIAQIYEANTAEVGAGQQPFFAMELVRGEPITRFAASRGLGTRDRLELVAKVSDAIHYAHQKGIIHRDLKPENILVDEKGQPKILDFGIARAAGTDAQLATLRTNTGQLLGTLPYMSPEQVSGDAASIDSRSDVYALGVILFEMLAGRLPHRIVDSSLFESLRVLREEEPLKLGSVSRALRGDLQTIASKALEKDRARRYASAAELAADIRRFLGDEPIIAHPPSALYQIRKFTARHKVLVGSAGLLFLVLSAATAVSLWLAAAARKEAAKANAVVGLFADMLKSASPHHLKGADYTFRQLLDDFEATLGDQLAGQPEVEGTMRNILGLVYAALASDKAKAQYDRAQELFLRELGEDHPRTLGVQANLASWHRKQGNLWEAEKMSRAILERRGAGSRRRDREQLQAMNVLANTYRQLGKRKEAEDLPADPRWLQAAERGEPGVPRDGHHEPRGPRIRRASLRRRREPLPRSLQAREGEVAFRAPGQPDEPRQPGHALHGEGRPHEARALPQGSSRGLPKGARAGPPQRPPHAPETGGPLLAPGTLVRCCGPSRRMAREGRGGLLRPAEDSPRDVDSPGRLPASARPSRRCGAHPQGGLCLPRPERREPRAQRRSSPQRSPCLVRRDGDARPSEGPGAAPSPGAAVPHRGSDRTGGRRHRPSCDAVHARDRGRDARPEPLAGARREWGLLARSGLRGGQRVPPDGATPPARTPASRHRLPLEGAVLRVEPRGLGFQRRGGHHPGGGGFRAVPADLTVLFNRDVVADPGDPEEDSVDGDAASLLLADGYDGTSTRNPEARGLPEDRRIGVHRLGDYGVPNALQLTSSARDPVPIPLPPGTYTLLRLLVTGGNGRSTHVLRVEYAGGTTEEHSLICPDWFADPPLDLEGARVTAVRNGMDRLAGGRFQDANAPAVFEFLVPLDRGRRLATLLLDTARSAYPGSRATFNLLAVTAMAE